MYIRVQTAQLHGWATREHLHCFQYNQGLALLHVIALLDKHLQRADNFLATDPWVSADVIPMTSAMMMHATCDCNKNPRAGARILLTGTSIVACQPNLVTWQRGMLTSQTLAVNGEATSTPSTSAGVFPAPFACIHACLSLNLTIT